MEAGYTIEHYGTYNPNVIAVINWNNLNQVSMTRYYSLENAYLPVPATVAIFKLKPKAK